MTLRAGQMRHRIEFQSRSTTQDTSGEPAQTWTAYAEAWASVEQGKYRGTEGVASAQRITRLPTIFRVRWVEGVVPAMRIVWAGRVFDIQDVQLPQGIAYRGSEMVITANELDEVSP